MGSHFLAFSDMGRWLLKIKPLRGSSVIWQVGHSPTCRESRLTLVVRKAVGEVQEISFVAAVLHPSCYFSAMWPCTSYVSFSCLFCFSATYQPASPADRSLQALPAFVCAGSSETYVLDRLCDTGLETGMCWHSNGRVLSN